MLGLVVAMAVLVLVTSLWLVWRARSRARGLEGDVLKRFFQCQQEGREVSLEALAGMLRVPLGSVRRCLRGLMERGLVRAEGPTLRLTAAGREAARAWVRSHRVLETYLAERAGRPLPLLHRLADRLEHRIPQERIDAMDRGLGHPVRDPHGDLIPGPRGRVHEPRHVPLALCPAGSVVRVLHVEDEPDALLRELLDQGVVPAAELEVVASDEGGVTVNVAGTGERHLDALAASVVDVVPSGVEAAELRGMVRLSELELGRSGRVVMLTNELRGAARRRLLDLGFTPGAEVTPVLENALGSDPTAYLIRQSRIALRRDQARHILVARSDDAAGASGEVAA
jgi:DtxR family transcriptional regulator, Mn-dependent transcriptional regulator